MYDLWYWFIFLFRYAANSLLAYQFAKAFLSPKLKGRAASFLCVFSLTAIQLAAYFPFVFFYRNRFDIILYVLMHLLGLILTLRLFFKGSWSRTLFCAFTLCGGRELMMSVIHVFDYCFMLTLWDMAVVFFEESFPEYYAAHREQIFMWFDIADSILAVTVYIVIYNTYLRLIKRSFENKTAAFSRYENMLLILPFISSVCISVMTKMMNQYVSTTYGEFFEKVSGGEYFVIMEEYFLSSFWILMSDICLMLTNVAYIKIFQRLADYNSEREKTRMLENQVRQTEKEIKEVQDIYTDIRGLRHDMKNSLESISLYIQRKYGEDKELSDYLGTMTNTVNRLDFSQNTGNGITDIILAQKTAEAAKRGITLTHSFAFPQKGTVDAYHIGIILNNALQNAVEACENEEEKEIYLCSYSRGSLYFIKCQNTFTGQLDIDKNSGLPLTKKENRSDHGIGLSNIKRCAEKYKGDMDFSAENGEFTLTVMLHT